MTKHDKWTVILLREPYMPNARWVDDRPRAMERAYSLAELHSCTALPLQASRRIYVFAKAYYAPNRRRS